MSAPSGPRFALQLEGSRILLHEPQVGTQSRAYRLFLLGTRLQNRRLHSPSLNICSHLGLAGAHHIATLHERLAQRIAEGLAGGISDTCFDDIAAQELGPVGVA